MCANAKQCIEMYRVCDGTPDCPLGDDEKSCVALADELEDNEVVPYNEEGIAHIFNLLHIYIASEVKRLL